MTTQTTGTAFYNGTLQRYIDSPNETTGRYIYNLIAFWNTNNNQTTGRGFFDILTDLWGVINGRVTAAAEDRLTAASENRTYV